jgi:pyruvate/2-oxoglutarate/acetoin dehydrogenase E1 component
LLQDDGPVPEGEYVIPLGRADLKRAGTDVSVITYARGVHTALDAAKQLAGHGIALEVLDLRSLVPLDVDAMVTSVRKTGRLLVLTEDCRTAGAAAEIIAAVTDNAFEALAAPPVRVCARDVPLPYSVPLQDDALPSVAQVVKAARGLLGR